MFDPVRPHLFLPAASWSCDSKSLYALWILRLCRPVPTESSWKAGDPQSLRAASSLRRGPQNSKPGREGDQTVVRSKPQSRVRTPLWLKEVNTTGQINDTKLHLHTRTQHQLIIHISNDSKNWAKVTCRHIGPSVCFLTVSQSKTISELVWSPNHLLDHHVPPQRKDRARFKHRTTFLQWGVKTGSDVGSTAEPTTCWLRLEAFDWLA